MLISLRARPVFYFKISKQLVLTLMAASKHHYDGACQRASSRAGVPLRPGSSATSPYNGLLTIWHDRFPPDADPQSEEEVSADWRDLDLVSKICEWPAVIADAAALDILRHRIRKIMDTSGPMVHSWQKEFEV